MPSTRRYLCEDEKDAVKECILAEKRVNISIKEIDINVFLFFVIDPSPSIYVSTLVNI